MPLYPSMSDSDKLARARRMFRETEAKKAEPFKRKSLCADFFHGRQWTPEQKKRLEAQGRPALTFNVIAPRVNSVVGMNIDNRMDVAIAPVGDEDRTKAEVLSILYEQAAKSTDLENYDDDVFERGFIEGDAGIHLDVSRDAENPLWMKIKPHFFGGREVLWDENSRERDRSDAQFFFWPRWLSRDDFEMEFPDEVENVARLFGKKEEFDADVGFGEGEAGGSSTALDGDDYEAPLHADMHRWIDSKRKRIRVIHMEYTLPIKRFYMISRDGQVREIEKKNADALRKRESQVRIVEAWDKQVHWFEFYCDGVLFDAKQPLPFKGWSNRVFSSGIDSESGEAVGPVDGMLDPQLDVNKGHSISLEHLMNQPKPGYNIEDGAVSDVDELDDAIAEGRTAVFKKQALSGGKVMERSIPQPSPAGMTRLETGLRMVGEVSGIVETAESPNRAQEQPVTVMLREKKAIRAHRRILKSFQSYQKRVAMAYLETILRSFPDDQIAALLGNSERYVVKQGQVFDVEKQTGFALGELRDHKFDIELQPSAMSDLHRLNQLSIMTQLAVVEGVHVEPEYMLELAAETRSARERLKKHQTTAAQQTAQQTQIAIAEQQAKVAQIEADTKALIDSSASSAETNRLKTAFDSEQARLEFVHQKTTDQQDRMLRLLEIIQKGDIESMDMMIRIFDQIRNETARDSEQTTPQ